MQKILLITMIISFYSCADQQLKQFRENQVELTNLLVETTNSEMDFFYEKQMEYQRSILEHGYKELTVLNDSLIELKSRVFGAIDDYDQNGYVLLQTYLDSTAASLISLYDHWSEELFGGEYMLDRYAKEESESYRKKLTQIKLKYDTSRLNSNLNILPINTQDWQTKVATQKLLFSFALYEVERLLADRGRCLCDDWDLVVNTNPKRDYQVGELYEDSLWVSLSYEGKRTDSIQIKLDGKTVAKLAYQESYDIGQYIEMDELGMHHKEVEVLMKDYYLGWIYNGKNSFDYEVVE